MNLLTDKLKSGVRIVFYFGRDEYEWVGGSFNKFLSHLKSKHMTKLVRYRKVPVTVYYKKLEVDYDVTFENDDTFKVIQK